MAALVRQVMTADPVTVAPDATVEDVVRAMREQELPGLPVVDGDNRLVGIVTESDLVIADDEGDLHIPHYIELFGGMVFLEPLRGFEARLKKAAAATARDMMTADPVTVEADDPVRKAARMIADSGHNRLPVVEGGKLVGVVTRVDVLGALAAE
ncbi:MAG TPA: CBS domain-containing protein [Thermoleophilaceae bacterium]|nr:CBS domain-containing protein [Thermoleophilaceae bacterium]